jgi:hypothetical protein
MRNINELWKSLTKNAGFFLLVPLMFATFKISGNHAVFHPGNISQNDLKSVILTRPLCVAKEYSFTDVKEPGVKYFIKIPSAALFKYMSHRNSSYRYRVVRIKTDSSEVKLKSIRITFIKEDSGYAIVSGLDAGDSLLINPKFTLKELVKIDKPGLRKAFSVL